jgi:PsbP-like protein
MKVVTQQNIIVDNEPTLKILADGIDEFDGIKFVQYSVMHNEEPYSLTYMANVKDYDKYLSDFEEMVDSFRFEN